MFVMGTWFLIKALGGSQKGEPVNAALYMVIGLGLKFPAAIYVLKTLMSRNVSDRGSAIAAVILVYSSTVVLMTLRSLRDNNSSP